MNSVPSVLHFGPCHPDATGGVAGVMQSVMAAATQAGIATSMAHDSGSGRQLGRVAAMRFRLEALRAAANQKSCRIVHLQACESTILWDALTTSVFSMRSRTVIAHVHCKPDALSRASAMQRIGWRLLRRSAKYLLVIAPGIDRQFRATWGDRVIVVPNFVDVDWIETATARVAKKRQAVFLGRMTRDKGVFELLRATERLSAAGWTVRFIGPFADPGEESEFRKALTSVAGAEWVGHQDGDAKVRYLAEASVFVLPSAHRGEIFPVAMLEAGAARCAVMSTGVGVISDVLCNWELGVKLPDNSAESIVAAFEQHASKFDDLAQRWSAEVKRCYSIPAVAAKLAGVYQAAQEQEGRVQ